jgi:UDP-N-acetylmuramoyl-L-alanyl-D-glutamate--2,6-diaminopimelate ligase
LDSIRKPLPRAIGRAIAGAGPGELVVIAGKGHERTQTVGGVELVFSDRASAEATLARL